MLPCWYDDTYGEDRLEVQDADRNARGVILPWKRSFMWPEFQCTDWMLQISGLWALILNVPWPSWIWPKILQCFTWHDADDHKTLRVDDAPSMKSICAKCNNLTATSLLFVMVCNGNNLKTISGSLGLTVRPGVEAWEAYLSLWWRLRSNKMHLFFGGQVRLLEFLGGTFPLCGQILFCWLVPFIAF